MELKTKYITLDDYKQYWGYDLALEFKGGETEARALLYRVENDIEAYLNYTYFQRIESKYPIFTEEQKRNYKIALLEQVHYTFTQGDILRDSGYDFESGLMSKGDWLSTKAHWMLKNCGLCEEQIYVR